MEYETLHQAGPRFALSRASGYLHVGEREFVTMNIGVGIPHHLNPVFNAASK
jgi:hypothetical protein